MIAPPWIEDTHGVEFSRVSRIAFDSGLASARRFMEHDVAGFCAPVTVEGRG